MQPAECHVSGALLPLAILPQNYVGNFCLCGKSTRLIAQLTRTHKRFEDSRNTALSESGGNAEKATHLLINRLLHGPSLMLKGAASNNDKNEGLDWETIEAVLGRVFDLQSSSTHKIDSKENKQ